MFGRESGGVTKFNGLAWRTYDTTMGLSDNSVMDMAVETKEAAPAQSPAPCIE